MIKKIEKPWGFEEILEENDQYLFKRLFMKKGHRCSLQYHDFKKETVYVLDGLLNVYIGKDKDNLILKKMSPGDSLTLNPLLVHRMEGETDCFYLESSSPYIDDVVRIEDDYQRE